MLDLICPAAAAMSQRVGVFVAGLPADAAKRPACLSVFEIGCGAGVTTRALLQSRSDLAILAVDNEPAMLDQARRNLSQPIGQGHVRFIEADALSALRALPADSQDVVASAYAVHNFLETYRTQVLIEIYRVLRPSGLFVNGGGTAMPSTMPPSTHGSRRTRFAAISRCSRRSTASTFSNNGFFICSATNPPITSCGLARRWHGCAKLATPRQSFREGVNTLLTAVKPAAAA